MQSPRLKNDPREQMTHTQSLFVTLRQTEPRCVVLASHTGCAFLPPPTRHPDRCLSIDVRCCAFLLPSRTSPHPSPQESLRTINVDLKLSLEKRDFPEPLKGTPQDRTLLLPSAFRNSPPLTTPEGTPSRKNLLHLARCFPEPVEAKPTGKHR